MTVIDVRADEVELLGVGFPNYWPAPIASQRVVHFLPPIADVEAAPWARSLVAHWHCIAAGG